MAVFAATVYERGFAHTLLPDVAQRAGVPPARLATWWPSPIDCLLDTVAAATHQLLRRATAAFATAAGDGPLALHQALATMLHDMASAPEMTYISVVELPRLGPLVHARQSRMLDLFCELLGPGFAALDEPLPSPEIVSVCLAGGLWESIRRRAVQRRLHELPDTLAAMSYVCVSTFFGTEEALRVSDRQSELDR